MALLVIYILLSYCLCSLHGYLTFWKAMYKKLEICFINSHTQALSRHSNNTAMDNQVCFIWRLFDNPVKPQNNTDTVRPLRGINKMAWGAKLLQMSATTCGIVKSLCDCRFLWPTGVHNLASCLAVLNQPTHPLIRGTCRKCKKTISKTSKPTSSIQVGILIAIVLLYF